jgi:uncharacterized protein
MIKDIWLNLPVKDIQRSKAFFTALGFEFNPRFKDIPDKACLLIGQNKFIVMLFEEAEFCGYTQHALADKKQGTEVLISIEAQSKAEVNEIAKKVKAAGGILFSEPEDFD